MESLLERWDNEIKSMRSDMDSMQAAINWLRAGQNELEAQDEMLSDQLDGLHYGVVMLVVMHQPLRAQPSGNGSTCSMWSVRTSLLPGLWDPTDSWQQCFSKIGDPQLGKRPTWVILQQWMEKMQKAKDRLQQILQLENQLGTLHKFMRP